MKTKSISLKRENVYIFSKIDQEKEKEETNHQYEE